MLTSVGKSQNLSLYVDDELYLRVFALAGKTNQENSVNLNDSLESEKQLNIELRRQIAVLETQSSLMQITVTEIDAALNQKDSEISSLRERITSLNEEAQQQIAEFSQQQTLLEAQCQKLATDHSNRMREIEQQVEQLQQVRTKLEADLLETRVQLDERQEAAEKQSDFSLEKQLADILRAQQK